MDTNAYVKRMETAVLNAQKAIKKLIEENELLKSKVSTLEKELKESKESRPMYIVVLILSFNN